MNETELKAIFSKNLKQQLEDHGKQPVDLVNDLHIPFSTVSNWINGMKFPRMGKIELLAHYFGIEKSDLIENKQKNDLQLSPEEQELIFEFRKMDDLTKEMVRRILGIEKEKEENIAL